MDKGMSAEERARKIFHDSKFSFEYDGEEPFDAIFTLMGLIEKQVVKELKANRREALQEGEAKGRREALDKAATIVRSSHPALAFEIECLKVEVEWQKW